MPETKDAALRTHAETGDAAAQRRADIDGLLSDTFNSILRIEERSLDNRLTHGLTITEVHTIVAVGLHEQNPMNVVAARLGVTLATLTTAVNKLVRKGFVERIRAEDDRRKVLVSLTKKGRQVFRAHNVFHRQMAPTTCAHPSVPRSSPGPPVACGGAPSSTPAACSRGGLPRRACAVFVLAFRRVRRGGFGFSLSGARRYRESACNQVGAPVPC